jgi:hypothetical protein
MFTFTKLLLFACACLAVAASAPPPFHHIDGAHPYTGEILPRNATTAGEIVTRSSDPFEDGTLDMREIRAHIEEHIRRSVEYEELDQRWVGAVVRGAAQLIMKVVDIVKGKIEHDKAVSSTLSLIRFIYSTLQARGEFTKHVVDEGRKERPDMNWIACHPKHRTQWKGTKGKDWDHKHQEFDVSFHKTVG